MIKAMILILISIFVFQANADTDCLLQAARKTAGYERKNTGQRIASDAVMVVQYLDCHLTYKEKDLHLSKSQDAALKLYEEASVSESSLTLTPYLRNLNFALKDPYQVLVRLSKTDAYATSAMKLRVVISQIERALGTSFEFYSSELSGAAIAQICARFESRGDDCMKYMKYNFSYEALNFCEQMPTVSYVLECFNRLSDMHTPRIGADCKPLERKYLPIEYKKQIIVNRSVQSSLAQQLDYLLECI